MTDITGQVKILAIAFGALFQAHLEGLDITWHEAKREAVRLIEFRLVMLPLWRWWATGQRD